MTGTPEVTKAAADVFAFYDLSVDATGPLSTGVDNRIGPIEFDITDGAGHGFLVATDQIYMQVFTNGATATATVRVKMLYRWKNVSLAEYIGIVQGQQ